MNFEIENAVTFTRTPRVMQLEGIFDIPPHSRSSQMWGRRWMRAQPSYASESKNDPPYDPMSAISKLEPGTFQVLFPGENVTLSKPEDDGGFENFIRVAVRSFAIGAGVTYEQATGDLKGVNYSSIRAGLLEFRRKCEQLKSGG